MKKRILIAALTAAMASSIFGVTVNAAERELNINWLSSRSASESAILQYRILPSSTRKRILIWTLILKLRIFQIVLHICRN